MTSIQWVLFDLGGVLVRIDQMRIFEELGRQVGRPADELQRAFVSASEVWHPFIVSEYTPAQLTREVNSFFAATLGEEEVVSAFNAELGETITATADLIPGLKQRTQVGCLSNTNSIHWDYLLGSYDFMGQFDRRFASQLLGSAKPSKAIYEKVQESLGVHPRDILFFDDKPENVETAVSLGWNARVYTSHDTIVRDLGEFKLV